MDIELRERSLDGLLDPIQSLTLRSMFWGPHYLDDSEWLEYIPFSYWLVEALEPETVLEIGAPELVSYFSMCHAVLRHDLGARCCVVYPAVAADGGDERLQRLQEWNSVQFHTLSRIVAAPLDEYLAGVGDGTVDLLHLDLCRREDWTEARLARLLATLSPRAVLVVHGTREHRPGGACGRLLADLVRNHPSFEFTHGAGMTVCAVGADAPGLVQTLCALAENARARQGVREVFARLGRACVDMQRTMRLTQLNRQLTGTLAREAAMRSDALLAAVAAPEDPDGTAAALARATREIAYLTDMLLKQQDAGPVRAAAPVPAAGALAHAAVDRPGAAEARHRELADDLQRWRKLAESYKTEAALAQEHRRQHEQELARLSALVLEKDRLIDMQAVRRQADAAARETRQKDAGLSLKRIAGWLRPGRRRKPSRLDREIQLLQESDLFDAMWYARRYLDGADPQLAARHFLTTGCRNGHHPSEKFDAAYYLEQNPDVRLSEVNPLIHYLKFGAGEKRKVRAVPPPRPSTDET